MNDAKKTKKQLIEELAAARAREETLRESEELYRTIVESIDLGLNLIDCDHNLVMVNAAQGRHFNKPPHEMVGRKCFWEFEKRDAVCPHCPGVQAIATGQPAEVETQGVRDDGSRFNVRLRAFPAFRQDGTVRGFIEIGQNITEQRQAEEAVQQREAVLGAMALAAEKFLRPGDWEQDIQAALAYLGKAADAIRVIIWEASTSDDGKYLISGRYEWLAPEAKLTPLVGLQNVPAFRRWRDLLPRGEIVTGHVRDFSAKEQELFVPKGIKSVLAVPVFVNDAWWGFMGFDQGVTGREWTEAEIDALKTAGSILGGALERKWAEEQLQQYASKLEQANEEVKQFAYIVSHDLRAPLTNLKGFSEELSYALEVIGSAMNTALPHLDEKQQQALATALQEDVPEALGFIDSSVTSMDNFINALLKLSRLGHRELKFELVDMEALVQAILETLAHRIEKRQVKVAVGPLPEVAADWTSMEQIMSNLLGNAVKYLDPDRPGDIEITGERDHEETTFRVRDNGRGIAEEDMPKVFAPFRRAGKQDVPGEGMGLPYVQALLRRHGGRIWCESKPGVGTTFTLTISNHLVRGERGDAVTGGQGDKGMGR